MSAIKQNNLVTDSSEGGDSSLSKDIKSTMQNKEALLNEDQEQQIPDSGTIETLASEEEEVIVIRGKYDLIADWDRPIYPSFSKGCVQGWRLFFTIGTAPMILIPVYLNGPIYMFAYCTQWGIQLLCYSCLLSYLAARNPQSYCLKSAACIMSQMGIGFNFVTMIGFWAVVAELFLPVAPTFLYKLGLILAHVIPLAIQLINVSISDVRMSKADIWQYFILSGTYMFLNYLFTKYDDEPVYPFCTWEDWRSPVYALISILIGGICYLLTAVVLEWVKGPYRRGITICTQENNSDDNFTSTANQVV